MEKILGMNLERYGELKMAEKKIKEEISELAKVILPEIKTGLTSGCGTFIKAKREIWKYSLGIEESEKALKEEKEKFKKENEPSGYTPYILFKAKK